MQCTSLARLSNFDGKNGFKLFVACHTGDKVTPKKTGIWTYSSDTKAFSATVAYLEEVTPGESFVADLNLDIRVVVLGTSNKSYLLVLNRAWKPDQVSKIAALIQIDDSTKELLPASAQTYSFAFSDGTTVLQNIQNVMGFGGGLVAVGMLTADLTQPIQMIYCPFGDTQGTRNGLVVIKCSADVPSKSGKSQKSPKNDDPV